MRRVNTAFTLEVQEPKRFDENVDALLDAILEYKDPRSEDLIVVVIREVCQCVYSKNITQTLVARSFEELMREHNSEEKAQLLKLKKD